MGLNVEMVTFDCADPGGLASWWAAQFDGETAELIPGEFVVVTRRQGPRLGFRRVPDPTPGKNRVHLDFSAADVDAEVARPVAAGASETGRHQFNENFPLGGAGRSGPQCILRGGAVTSSGPVVEQTLGRRPCGGRPADNSATSRSPSRSVSWT